MPSIAEAAPRARLGRKPHVCFVALTAWPVFSRDPDIAMVGGAEVQQSMISRALAARGYPVSMITYDHGQGDGLEIDGIAIHTAYRPDAGVPVARFVWPRMTGLWRALREVDADVYYQRTSAVATGITAAFCRRHGRHGIYAGASDVDFLPGRQDIQFARDRRIFEWGLKRMDQVFVQNEAQLASLSAHYDRLGRLIPNCYAPPAGTRAGRRGEYVLWVATVRPSKRPELLLELARRMPQRRFVMVGGPDPGRKAEAYFQSIAEAAARLPNVSFKGFMPFAEAERWFDGARLVINTSLYEGFPNTFLQAWARGIPTVAFIDTGSRHGGRPAYEIVGDIGEMSWKVDRLMQEDLPWREASQRVESHFRERHSIEAVAGLYEEALAKATVRA